MKPTPRDRRLLLLYGITEDEYGRVLAHQGGRCAVCRREPKRLKLAVDHAHGDGLTRGFLCMACNKALAYLRDDPDAARRAAQYLVFPPAAAALGYEVYGRPGRASRKWRTKRERRERMQFVAGRLKDLGYV